MFEKSKSAIVWNAADLVLRQCLGFGFGVAMARLLTPEEYGTFALLYLFVGIASCFVDSGFASALIQAEGVDDEDKSSVFWFNTVMGVVMALGLTVSASRIALFFDKPILVGLTWGMAANIAITSLGSVQSALFTKYLQFRPIMVASVLGTLVGGIIGIGMAWGGFGVWSILWQTLASTSVSTVTLWCASEWRPRCVFSVSRLAKFFRFGGFLMASALMDTFYNRFYTLLLGKYFGTQALGLYSRADQLQQLPAQSFTKLLTRITFPLFSSIQTEPDKLRSGVEAAIRCIMFLNIPAMFGLIATAENLVVVVFGEPWREAAPILQVLAMAGILWPLHVVNLNVLKAQGRSDLFLRLEIVKKIIGTALLVTGAWWGVMGIAYSVVINSTICFFLNAWYSGVLLNYGPLRQIKVCLPLMSLGLVMAGLVLLTGEALDQSRAVVLGIQITVGVLFWGLLAVALLSRGGLNNFISRQPTASTTI